MAGHPSTLAGQCSRGVVTGGCGRCLSKDFLVEHIGPGIKFEFRDVGDKTPATFLAEHTGPGKKVAAEKRWGSDFSDVFSRAHRAR